MKQYFILNLTILFISIFHSSLHAQKANHNRLDEEGNKVGYWIEKNDQGEMVAKGMYEYGERQGNWQFFLSSVARYTQTPDLKGRYEDGRMHGKWEATVSFYDRKDKLILKGLFEHDSMDGVWTIEDQMSRTIAKGEYVDGVRNGNWTLFHDGTPLDRGEYKDGKKIGTWVRDCTLQEGTMRLKGVFLYGDDEAKGKLEIYKIDKHKHFGKDEVLMGTGSYLNGKKTGRWIEYQRNVKGEALEIGYYDGDGLRTGLWEHVINNKPYRESAYNDGLLHGRFINYYEDGQIQYKTSFEMGQEHGFFTNYYPNGQIKEKGAHTLLVQDIVEDTIYHKTKLPISQVFRIIKEPDYANFNLNALEWIYNQNFSLNSEELDNRFREYLDYQKSDQLEIEEILKSHKQVVRVGDYIAYYDDGQVKEEGKYLPKLILEGNTKKFVKDGEWKYYDALGYPNKVEYFQEGKLIRRLNNKGEEISIEDE
ncbi:MAG: hypothetical protein MK212_15400 [Saprospiraceae bacterium]|nr:hypothetical protein [Saprospiraceae bacterium]